MRHNVGLFFAAVLGLGVCMTPAQAGVKWSYSASDATVFNTNNSDQTSAIKFQGAANSVEGDSGIIMYRLLSVWDPLSKGLPDTDGPDSLDGVSSAYSLVVKLTDDKSGVSGNLVWNGRFKGKNFTEHSFSADSTAFNWDSPLAQKITLGDNTNGFRDYLVEILFNTPPGAPGDPGGAIYAEVAIRNQDDNGGGNPGDAPEPASLTVALLGLPGFLVWRRRMKKSV